MMEGRTPNFGAALCAVKYSNFTLDDELLSLMVKMNKAGPLNLNSFHPKGKMLSHIGHLN
jgi:N-acetylglutamate synthase/N-acetylornithine aminotransferase